jgi:hypothetical protein
MPLESLHDFSGTHPSPQEVLVHVRIEIADAKRFQSMLRGEVLDDLHVKVDATVRPGVAAGADDHRHAKLTRRQQHVLKVLGLPTERAGRRVRAERHRTDVVATRVGGNVIRRSSDAEPETLDA